MNKPHEQKKGDLSPDAFFGSISASDPGDESLYQPGDWKFVAAGLTVVLLCYGVAAWLDDQSSHIALQIRLDAHAQGYEEGKRSAQHECDARASKSFPDKQPIRRQPADSQQ